MAKASELRTLADEELEGKLAEASQELFNLRFQVVTGQLDNVSRIGSLRREVARCKTLLREREIDSAEALTAGRGPAAPAGGATRPGAARPGRAGTDEEEA